MRNVKNCHVVTVVGGNFNGAVKLFHDPTQVLAGIITFSPGATHVGNISNILDNTARGARQLAPCGTLFPKSPRHFLHFQTPPVSASLFGIRNVVLHILCQELWNPALYGSHDLQLCTSAASPGPENCKFFCVALFAATPFQMHKEHDGSVLLLHLSQETTVGPGHKPNTVAWNLDDGAILLEVGIRFVKNNFSNSLSHHTLHIFFGAPSFLISSGDFQSQGTRWKLHTSARHTDYLFFGLPILTKDKRSIGVCQLHIVHRCVLLLGVIVFSARRTTAAAIV
mmetsp:Transcript_3795/g.6112  ORF Transcript_3795/g.6112 Transcript_3795/m.6112 type:complete len:282 (-) Transcript_3795:109-954(-)